MKEKRYVLKYFSNEVSILEFNCANHNIGDQQCCVESGCGYTLAEAKQAMANHYRRVADQIDSMSIEAFGHWANWR